MDQTLVQRIVEAALLAANQPLTPVQLQGLFPLDEPAPEGGIARALESLQAAAAERGVELVEVASGWRYQVCADVHPWVARLWTERQVKYTRATLETLALIAYRQPITRGEIEQVRGVAVNSNIIKALEEREWIRVVGHRDVPGRPELLGTTRGFLDYFGLKRLDELPPLSELKDFGELDPQFAFDGERTTPLAIGDITAGDITAGDMTAGDMTADDMTADDMAVGDMALDATAGGDDGARDEDSDTDVGAAGGDPAGHDAGIHPGAAGDDLTANDDDVSSGEHPAPFPDPTHDTALAEDGDSTGARHE